MSQLARRGRTFTRAQVLEQGHAWHVKEQQGGQSGCSRESKEVGNGVSERSGGGVAKPSQFYRALGILWLLLCVN